MSISTRDMRRLALNSQGLLKRAQFGRGLNAVQKAVSQLGYVQIDTISVVDRAHHHILRTRVPNYNPVMLHKLQTEKHAIFEYWAHAASYLPIKDYRYYQPVMQGFGTKRQTDRKIRKNILNRIAAEGPLQSRDFDNPTGRKSDGWWDWKPAKQVMEHLFLSGELMIRERRGFQKVYDLTENVLPDTVDQSSPTDQERGHFYIRRMLGALGFASERQIAYDHIAVNRFSNYNIRPAIKQALADLLESAEIQQVDFCNEPYFYLVKALSDCPGKLGQRRVNFLSPFDNLVINRKRLLDLFGFDYQLECYVPQAKRKFGYFVLPILYGDVLVGRMDCKAVRKEKTLSIRNIWLEPKTKLTGAFVTALALALKEYQTSLQCEQTIINKSEPATLRQLIQ